MMKNVSMFRNFAILFCICALTAALSGCGESKVNLSKNMVVANETDVTVTSITLNVTQNPLNPSIELLKSPLAPGEMRQITFSVPEKQAKQGTWIVQAVTEEGSTNPFEFGSFNPHGEGKDISRFGVLWNEDRNRYSVKVYVGSQ